MPNFCPRFGALLALIFLALLRLDAQCTGDFVFSTQADLDTFPACSELVGNLTITGNDIEDLSPLSSLETITGSLNFVGASLLSDFVGLENLAQVSGTLMVNGNADLESFDGLGGLQHAGEIIILTNGSLLSLDGLENLQTVDSTLLIAENDQLETIGGLASLASVGRLVVSNNPILYECCAVLPAVQSGTASQIVFQGNGESPCNGADSLVFFCSLLACKGDVTLRTQEEIGYFNACETWEGNLVLSGPDIVDLSPMSTLETVTGNLTFVGNDILTSFSGLEALRTVGGSFNLFANPYLITLNGLSGLRNVGQSFSLEGNLGLVTAEGAGPLAGTASVVSVQGNPYLEDVKCLANLKTVDQLLLIRGNNRLKNLGGLKKLETVNGNFILEDNAQLASLQDLEMLATVGQNLEIRNNASLADCCSLLPVIENQSPDTIVLENNPAFCGSVAEILDDCTIATGTPQSTRFQCVVYPNPATDVVNLEISLAEADRVSARLFDGSGRLRQSICTEQFFPAGKTALPLQLDFPGAGLYFFEVKSSVGVRVLRFVKI